MFVLKTMSVRLEDVKKVFFEKSFVRKLELVRLLLLSLGMLVVWQGQLVKMLQRMFLVMKTAWLVYVVALVALGSVVLHWSLVWWA